MTTPHILTEEEFAGRVEEILWHANQGPGEENLAAYAAMAVKDSDRALRARLVEVTSERDEAEKREVANRKSAQLNVEALQRAEAERDEARDELAAVERERDVLRRSQIHDTDERRAAYQEAGGWKLRAEKAESALAQMREEKNRLVAIIDGFEHREAAACPEGATFEQHIADLEQQLRVLRPGGEYAWKQCAEQAEARLAQVREALDRVSQIAANILSHEPNADRYRVGYADGILKAEESVRAVLADTPAPPLLRAVTEGYALRRKYDGHLWAPDNGDAKVAADDIRLSKHCTLGSMSAEYWEMVYVRRTVTIERAEAPAPTGGE